MGEMREKLTDEAVVRINKTIKELEEKYNGDGYDTLYCVEKLLKSWGFNECDKDEDGRYWYIEWETLLKKRWYKHTERDSIEWNVGKKWKGRKLTPEHLAKLQGKKK